MLPHYRPSARADCEIRRRPFYGYRKTLSIVSSRSHCSFLSTQSIESLTAHLSKIQTSFSQTVFHTGGAQQNVNPGRCSPDPSPADFAGGCGGFCREVQQILRVYSGIICRGVTAEMD
jgi:hypothetical protein